MVRRGRSTETGAARGNLPAPAGQKGMDRKVGKQGEETAGHTSSQGSCGASGTAACAGADLRKRLRSAQLRVSAGEKRPAGTGAGGDETQRRIPLGGGRRSQKLLRHHTP